MKRFRAQRPRLGFRLLGAAVVFLLVAAGLTIGLRPAAAQMQFDFNGDGEVHCDDFQQEFPDTFTDEATKALQQYPDDLSDLNNDAKQDAVACEGQAAAADPGDGPAAKKNAKSTPTPTPTPAPAAPVAAPAAPPSNATESTDIPADVMARIEGCAVVAISSHDVTAAGCPGGTLIFHIPDDAPPLPDTVIMNPGAALQQTSPAPRASNNSASTTNTGNESSNTKSGQGSGKATKSNKDNSTDTSKANKNKNTDTSKKDKNKNGKHKGKKGKNDKDNKHNKHGKKSKNHGKKGK